MRSVLSALAALLIVIAVVLVWSLALGWALTLVLPFDLFQGALLAMLASGIGAYAFFHSPNVDEREWDDAVGLHDIPLEQFCRSEADRTWANWARHEIANAILYALQQALDPGTLDASARESVAILLSGPAVALLRRKSARSTKLEVTVAQLRNQMQRMELEPLDEPILRAAVEGINLALTAAPVAFAVRKQV